MEVRSFGKARGFLTTARQQSDRRFWDAPRGERRQTASSSFLWTLLIGSLCFPQNLWGQTSTSAPVAGEYRESSTPEGWKSGCSTGAFRYVEDLLRAPWEAVSKAVERSSSESLQNALNRLYQVKLDSGFPNSPRFAVLLLRKAYRFLDTGQTDTARLLGESALNLAPDFAPVHRLQALTAAKDPGMSFLDRARRMLACWKSQVLDFQWQYRTAGKFLLLLFAALYGLLLLQGPYVLVRYGPLASHRLKEGLRLDRAGIFLLWVGSVAACLGAVALLGPFWTVVALHFCLGPYARRWEKSLFVLLLSVWIFAPWIARATVRQLSPLPDAAAALYALEKGEWDRAAEEALEDALAGQPESPDILWATALVEKRTGRYREAEAHLRRALELDDRNGALWNNLGNLLAFSGRTEEAKKAYERSIECDPDLAEPQYNLSQILRREFSFLKGAAAFEEARRLDPGKIDSFVYIHSPHPNRFYMDVGPGSLRMWLNALRAPSDIRQSGEELWDLAGTRTSSRLTGLMTAILVLAYALLVLSGKVRAGAYRCQTCGSVACSFCQPIPSARQTCNPCHQVLYQRTEIPKEHRQKQIARMARYGRRRGRAAFTANLFLPGLGQAALQDRPAEAVRFCLFMLAVVLVVGWRALVPVHSRPWQQGCIGDGAWPLALLLLLAGYGLLQRRFLRRTASGR